MASAGGLYRISYSLAKYGSPGPMATVYAQLYVNNIPRGILRSITHDNTTNATQYVEDMDLNVGDVLNIYGWSNHTYGDAVARIEGVLTNVGFANA